NTNKLTYNIQYVIMNFNASDSICKVISDIPTIRYFQSCEISNLVIANIIKTALYKKERICCFNVINTVRFIRKPVYHTAGSSIQSSEILMIYSIYCREKSSNIQAVTMLFQAA